MTIIHDFCGRNIFRGSMTESESRHTCSMADYNHSHVHRGTI